jgi:hypothetical protein
MDSVVHTQGVYYRPGGVTQWNEYPAMKRLRVTTTLEEGVLPPLYAAVADDARITELRVIDWNLAAADVGTLLYEIDGDPEAFREGARETDGADEVDVIDGDEGPSYALLSARPAAIPFFSTFMSLTARAGLVVRKPLVYRDHCSSGRVVGEPEPLQRAIDETPPGVSVQVEQIGNRPSEADTQQRLTDRQRAAVETAFELGYYDQPRRATHEDIASELDCAPTTATTHLHKGEAKIIESVLNDFETNIR